MLLSAAHHPRSVAYEAYKLWKELTANLKSVEFTNLFVRKLKKIFTEPAKLCFFLNLIFGSHICF